MMMSFWEWIKEGFAMGLAFGIAFTIVMAFLIAASYVLPAGAVVATAAV